jgi:hypothetical protein
MMVLTYHYLVDGIAWSLLAFDLIYWLYLEMVVLTYHYLVDGIAWSLLAFDLW